MRYGSSFLIYSSSSKALKIHHDSVFTFVQTWVPGIISNYRRVIRSIIVHKQFNNKPSCFPGKRPQLDKTYSTLINNLPTSLSMKKKLKYRFRFPAISLSTLDNYLWLNECQSLAIPSIQVCDTQSYFHQVTYPIIANQRSINFSYFIIHLAAEISNTSLLNPHLEFLSFYKYHCHTKNLLSYVQITKRVPLINIVKRAAYKSTSKDLQEALAFPHIFRNPWEVFAKRVKKRQVKYIFSPYTRRQLKLKRQLLRRSEKVRGIIKNKALPLVSNKRTYIFNKRNFTYQIKDLINKRKEYHYGKTTQYYKSFRNYLCKCYLYIRKLFKRLTFLYKRMKFWRYRRAGLNKLFKVLMPIYHRLIVMTIGLRKALTRKKRQRRRFITLVSFTKQDIKSLVVCSYMITGITQLTLLKNIAKKV